MPYNRPTVSETRLDCRVYGFYWSFTDMIDFNWMCFCGCNVMIIDVFTGQFKLMFSL